MLQLEMPYIERSLPIVLPQRVNSIHELVVIIRPLMVGMQSVKKILDLKKLVIGCYQLKKTNTSTILNNLASFIMFLREKFSYF